MRNLRSGKTQPHTSKKTIKRTKRSTIIGAKDPVEDVEQDNVEHFENGISRTFFKRFVKRWFKGKNMKISFKT